MNSIKNYFQSPLKENVNSKIIENMTAVIKSGKKKRKRNKHLDKNESVISDISQTLSNNLNFQTINNISNISEENIVMNSSESLDEAEDHKTNKVKNVFEVMMDARNRIIGSNSNGIVLETEQVDIEKVPHSVKNKRKLMLEKWCEEKGKKERMLKEEAEIELINKKMEKRAERLKKLLTANGNETNKTEVNKSEKRMKKTKVMAKKKLVLEEELENETSPSNKYDILEYFPKLNGSLEEKNENIRPRRSCTKNKSYIFDLSPPKEENSVTTQNKRVKRLMNTSPNAKSKKQKLESNDEDVEIVSYEVETPKKPKAELKNIKLAPLFIKQTPKPAIAPEVLKARQEFLMSGIPDSLRLEMARQKSFEDEYELNYSCFPEISHVTQLYSKYHQNKLGSSKINLVLETYDDSDIVMKYAKLKLGLVTNCNKNPGLTYIPKYNGKYEINKISRKILINLIKNLKSDSNNYPVYRCYKQLKLKCKQHSEIAKSNEEAVVIVNDVSFQNGIHLFNEIFKPKCLNEIFINYRQGVELKRFLSNWQENYYSHKDSDDSLSNSFSTVNNSASNFVVLIGPYGCGKTNSVYAIAQEMNFKVLEINCGSKRTGKKMLQKLHEATQSHSVHKNKSNSQKTDETDSKSDSDMNTKKLALILIEDSDIVFEQDDGFISAINQLISTSKRPVILVSNNPHSNHLLKFMEHNSIIYDAPSLVNVAKYVSLIGLVEHCFLDYGELGKLIQYNQNDLRRTINMVQFFIQSGGDRQTTSSNPNKIKPAVKKITDTFGLSEMLDVDDDNSKLTWYDSDEEIIISKRKSSGSSSISIHRHTNIFQFFIKDQNCSSKFQFCGNFNTLWFNIPILLLSKYDSKIKANKKPCDKIKAIKSLNTLNQISNFYDNISVALVLDAEKINRDYSFSCDLSKEIVSTVVEYSLEMSNVDYKNYDVLLNNNHEPLGLLYNSLSSTVGSNTTRMAPTPSVALDYEPYLRSMCRIEKDRQHNTDRRSTRFYHYLRNSINACTFGTEHFDKHANILNDQFD